MITCSKSPSRLESSNTIVSVSQPPVSKIVELLTFCWKPLILVSKNLATLLFLQLVDLYGAVMEPFLVQSKDQIIFSSSWNYFPIFNRD